MSTPTRHHAIVVLSAVGFALGANEARRGVVRPTEARCFQRINALPRTGFAPVWAVMQVGSLAGSVGVGLTVAATGRSRLGATLALSASATWAAAKAVKPFIQRGRPTALVEEPRILGREQGGLGYPSGHAAVATALAAVSAPHVTPWLRSALWATATGVGTARVYVGAHLPLDVVGGMALGLGIGLAAAPYGSSGIPSSASSSWRSWRRG
jgi:membrane-associated phospholipid phosphatase